MWSPWAVMKGARSINSLGQFWRGLNRPQLVGPNYLKLPQTCRSSAPELIWEDSRAHLRSPEFSSNHRRSSRGISTAFGNTQARLFNILQYCTAIDDFDRWNKNRG